MVKSFPYNVVITKSRDVADQLILGNYKKLLRGDIKEALVIGPYNNSRGFIQLDYNYGKTSGQFLTMKFLESSEILEYFLMNDSVEDRLVKEYLDLSNEERKDQAFAGFDIEDILKRSTKYYISFGLGDNLKEWSGPHVCYLKDANLFINADGVREVELMLAPSQNSILAEPAFVSSRFQGREDTGEDPRYGITAFGKDKFKCSADMGIKIPRLSLEPAQVGTKRWDFYIRKLVTKYISNLYQVPEKNVLVLFSKTFEAELSPIVQADKEIRGALDSIGFLGPALSNYGIDIALTTSIQQQQFNAQLPYYIKQKFQSLRNTIPKISKDVYERVSKGAADYLEDQRKKDEVQDPLEVDTGGVRVFDPDRPITLGDGVYGGSEEQMVKDAEEARKSTGSIDFLTRQQDLEQARQEQVRPLPLGPNGQPDVTAALMNEVPLSKEEISLGIKRAKDKNRYDTLFLDIADQRATPEQRTAMTVTQNAVRSNSDQLAELKSKFNLEDHVLSMTASLHKESADAIRTIGAFQKPLVTFCDKLRNTTDNKLQGEIQLVQETNLKIKKLLEKYNIIENANEPVILFGEENIINNLIYGSKLMARSENALSLFENDPDRANYPIDYYGYYQAIREFLYLSKRQTSSFGEKVDFGSFTRKYKDMVGGTNLVFMHNVKNSNILTVNFSFKGYLSTLLATPVRSRQRDVAMNTKIEYITSDDSISINSIKAYVEETVKPAKDKTPQDLELDVVNLLYTDDDFIDLVRSKEEFKNVKLIDFLEVVVFLIINARGKDSPYRETDLGSAEKQYTGIMESIRKIQRTLNIKTLPFFNQPSTYLGRECFVFGTQNSIQGSPLTGNEIESVYNGEYTIQGYRHVVGARECYSEFNLVRAGNSSKMNITLGKLLGF
jgi:hypothetical protein